MALFLQLCTELCIGYCIVLWMHNHVYITYNRRDESFAGALCAVQRLQELRPGYAAALSRIPTERGTYILALSGG